MGKLNQIRVVCLIRLHDSPVIDELSSRQLESPIGVEEMMRQAGSRAAVRSIPSRSVLSMSHSRPAANWFGTTCQIDHYYRISVEAIRAG